MVEMNTIPDKLVLTVVVLVCLACNPLSVRAGHTTHGPFQLSDENIQKLSISSSSSNEVIGVYETSNGVFAFVDTAEHLEQGHLPPASKIRSGTTNGIAVDMDSEGYSAWIAFSTLGDNLTCNLAALRWNQGFEEIMKVDAFTVADEAACSLETMTVIASSEKGGAMITFAYRYDSQAGRAVVYTFDETMSKWDKTVLCCGSDEPNNFVLADTTHFSVSTTEEYTMIAYTKTTINHTPNQLITEFFHQLDHLSPFSFPIDGSPLELGSAIHLDGTQTAVIGTNSSHATVFLYDVGKAFVLDTIYKAPEGYVIREPSIAFLGEEHAVDSMWRAVFQVRNLTQQNIIACEQNSETCIPVWEQSPNDVFVSDQSGSLSSIFFSEGVNNDVGLPSSVEAVYGFNPHVQSLNSFTIITTTAPEMYCSLQLFATSQVSTGTSIVYFTVIPCTNSEQPANTTKTYVAFITNAQEQGYYCSPQFQCVMNASAPFPDVHSCSSGCIGPVIENGYVCTDSGSCVQSATDGQYPSMQFCEDMCYPIPNQGKSKKLTGGSIFLLILVFGIVFPYFFFGMLYNVFVKKAQGNEIVPHHDFWCYTLPANIRAGFRCVTGKSASADNYEAL